MFLGKGEKMKVKNTELEWNVLRHDFNSNKIINYNIFNTGFVENVHKEVLKKRITTIAELKEYIKKWAIYHYWCKAEHEIVVGGLFFRSTKDLEKIDIYRQIDMNLDRIVEYVNRELRLNF